MDLREALRVPGRFSANPDRYDYLHFFELDEHGAVEMIDGGGQALRRKIVGRMTVLEATAAQAEVRFHELLDVDPYERSEERTPIDDVTIRVQVETGPFALRCEVMWHVEEDEAPWLLFEHRLAFDVDPLAAGRPSMPDWPPEVLEHPEMQKIIETMRKGAEGARRYYLGSTGKELPRRELMAMGLPPEAFVG